MLSDYQIKACNLSGPFKNSIHTFLARSRRENCAFHSQLHALPVLLAPDAQYSLLLLLFYMLKITVKCQNDYDIFYPPNALVCTCLLKFHGTFLPFYLHLHSQHTWIHWCQYTRFTICERNLLLFIAVVECHQINCAGLKLILINLNGIEHVFPKHYSTAIKVRVFAVICFILTHVACKLILYRYINDSFIHPWGGLQIILNWINFLET